MLQQRCIYSHAIHALPGRALTQVIFLYLLFWQTFLNNHMELIDVNFFHSRHKRLHYPLPLKANGFRMALTFRQWSKNIVWVGVKWEGAMGFSLLSLLPYFVVSVSDTFLKGFLSTKMWSPVCALPWDGIFTLQSVLCFFTAW